jgi:hypothetical protein
MDRRRAGRRVRAVIAGASMTLLAACASTGIPAAPTQATVSASVTQTAPSVWSGPESESGSAAASSSASAAASASTMPGLSEACTTAIRAQVAVNKLLAQGLGKTATDHTTTGSADAPPATTSSPAVPAADGGITAARVAEVFDGAARMVPASLTASFTTLRRAATDLVGRPIDTAPAVLASKPVADAMRTISDYIASCQPSATS